MIDITDVFVHGYCKGYEDRAKERSYDPHSHDIPTLTDANNHGWISIDNPPTTDDFVFVLLHGRFPALGKYNHDIWEAQALGSQFLNLVDGARVTHWLPSPQPPEE